MAVLPGARAHLALHVELHCEARLLREFVPKLLHAGLDVVVDHFGRPDPALGHR